MTRADHASGMVFHKHLHKREKWEHTDSVLWTLVILCIHFNMFLILLEGIFGYGYMVTVKMCGTD